MHNPTVNLIDADQQTITSEPINSSLKSWLASFEYSKSTYLSYKAVVNKILAFLQEKQLKIDALSDDDGKALLEWVRDYYQLSNSSMKHFTTVANTVFEFLRDEDYLSKNPLRLHKKSVRIQKQETDVFVNTPERVETYLDLEAWQWLWNWLCTRNALTEKKLIKNQQARFIFSVLYHTGIRREELTKLKMKHVFYRNNHWKMLVQGKGGKTRTVSVNSALLSEFFRYREAFGMEASPSIEEEWPLIMRTTGDRLKPYSVRGINYIIDQIKIQIGQEINNHPSDQIMTQLGAMTTHWLRHTNATHRLSAGASLETTQDELGHSNPATTRIYAHTLDEKRSDDAEKLAEFNNKG